MVGTAVDGCFAWRVTKSPEPKSPEQIPPNPLLCTEFLPMYTSKPHSKPHFSPQNLLSLFLHSSTFLFIFCAIIHSQKMLFFFPFSGCPSLNYNPQNDFIASFRYLHIKHWLYSHFCSTQELRALACSLHATRHTQIKQPWRSSSTTPLLPQQQCRHHR